MCGRAAEIGLAVRGAFHPKPGEFGGALSSHGTVVLLGFTGGLQWPHFADAPEAHDALPHPLDRWSRRMIGSLAHEFDARAAYPSGQPAAPVPFQQLARRCEPVHASPIGLLIHPRWGLWHAYRGALLMPPVMALPPPVETRSPCTSCRSRPCLSGCPVNAFGVDGYRLEACVAHVLSDGGRECRERGCLARRACPVGEDFRYGADQAQFHMQAFLLSVRDIAR